MNWIRVIQKNRVFRFASSVRLAVPLMATLLLAAATGTVLESRYNSQVAAIYVYHSTWFLLLLALLWVNIFSATFARIPFRKSHVGFVITHIGLLTLLIGGIVTATVGVDGQLRVVQGSSDNEVFLQNLVVRVEDERGSLSHALFPRTLKPMGGEELDAINDAVGSGFLIDRYEPFVAEERGFVAGGDDAGRLALQFSMKSRFFDVTDWLDSRDHASMQMGPATLRLVFDSASSEKKSKPRRPSSQGSATRARSGAILRVKEFKSGKVLAEIPVSELEKEPQKVGLFEVKLARRYEAAVVAGGGAGKLDEQGIPGKNPALDLRISHQGQEIREVIFSHFPGFSLQPKGVFGMRFEYVVGAGAASEEGLTGRDAETSVEGGAAERPREGNVVEFHVDSKSAVTLELFKNGNQVLKQAVQEGVPVQTPWMGMQVTLRSIVRGGQEVGLVRPIELPVRAQMPPSALRVHVPGQSGQQDDGVWIVEGERRSLTTQSGTRFVYFGPDSIHLPFRVALKEFSKVDYPGTDTAMSYQSRVQVDGADRDIVISMNEPFKRAGFTLYQSSYVLEPGQPPMSIFSVNRDPGRFIKYAGSLILVIGIALFTLMRSSWYLKRGVA
ncbi:MAG: cytochrome c biogenesis protein ResB [Oligoflexia bacterium]|nr:cytochrome c biogenesis protein ResB [Oligoflexia bacterium]